MRWSPGVGEDPAVMSVWDSVVEVFTAWKNAGLVMTPEEARSDWLPFEQAAMVEAGWLAPEFFPEEEFEVPHDAQEYADVKLAAHLGVPS